MIILFTFYRFLFPKDSMSFFKKEKKVEKEVALSKTVAPVSKKETKKSKCKFHKAHDRHCVDCNSL